MKTRITIHQMKKTVALNLLETLSQMAKHNHGKIRLKNRKQDEFLDVKLLSLSKKELYMDLSFAERDYTKLIRWCKSLTESTEWYFTLSVSSQSEDEYFLDTFKIAYNSVVLISTRKNSGEIPLSD